MVLCDSAQGAIVETISQLFLPACDRPVGLMWEPCTPPPTADTPSPQCLRLSQQEGKVSARLWHQNKSERAKMAGERIESSPKYTRWHKKSPTTKKHKSEQKIKVRVKQQSGRQRKHPKSV